MNSRERVIRAIEFGGPDRVPIMHTILPGSYPRFGEALGALLRRYPEDFGDTGYVEPSEYGAEIGIPQKDGWGAAWLRTVDDTKGQVVEHPLADWSRLDGYRFPDPLEIGDWSAVEERLRGLSRQKYVLVDGDTLFQRMFYLRGYESLMIDLALQSEEVRYLRDQIVRFMLRKIEKWLEFGVDGFQFRDDWGTQQGMMINPELWRSFFKPSYAELFRAVKAGGKHVWFHSDGQILPIVGDLVEIGADVVNPQAALIGFEPLSRRFAGKVCFLGDVDRQQVLPFGTTDEVRAHCVAAIEAFGSHGGGYIGRGELAVDVPLANAEAMYDTFWSYRPS